MRIQAMLMEGVAPSQIKMLLNTTYNRIRRYAIGDPLLLCRFSPGIQSSLVHPYRDAVIDLLAQNVTKQKAFEAVVALGYTGKLTAFKDYCRKLIVELGLPYSPKRTARGISIIANHPRLAQHYISRKQVEKYLWSGIEIPQEDIDYIINKYPAVIEIQRCTEDFRAIYVNKSVTELETFAQQYSVSGIGPFRSFASGLCTDWDAVKNSVISDMSNGFVEGINNKIKVIKRTMYGRAKIDLLRVKVLFARR